MDMKPETDGANAADVERLFGEIEFRGVSYGYDGSRDVLKDIDLKIEKGKTFALVGPSGGGKTTICHLIPHFYNVERGKILIDGKEIDSITLASLRRNIGIVQQDIYLFNASIRDNILYGRLDATDDEVIEAAKRANIHDYITSLEHGYDTVNAWVDEVYSEQIGAMLWTENEDWKTVDLPVEAYQFFYQYNLDIHHSNAFYYFDNDFDAYLTYLNITLEDLEKSAKEVARRFYVAAQIVDRHELTADEDLLKKLENEFLQDYMNNGYTEAQAKEVLENEGKLEFQALVENTLAQLYFVNNNTFTSETE
jgi:ABC-type sugar transport system ATPase subunit